MRSRNFAAPLLLSLLLLMGACGGGEEVGEAFEGFEEGQQQTGERLGEVEVTPTPAPATEAPEADPTPAPEQPQEQPQEQPDQQQQPAIEVQITSSGFDPQVVRMFVGGTLQVTNADEQPRTYTAANRTFDSGQLAPGESWTYKPQSPGRFDVEDDTRPYVVGTLEVLSR